MRKAVRFKSQSQVSGLRSPVSSSPMAVLRGKTIGVIGAGTMGQALIQGLLARGVRRAAVRAADPDAGRRDAVRRRFRLKVGADNARTVRASDIVILAIKPQQFPDVVAHLAPHLRRGQLVVSIAAGITLRWLEARLPGLPVVRVMPNLPATVGCGFAAMAAGRRATAESRQVVRAIFESVGDVVELPERRFDASTAVSGSLSTSESLPNTPGAAIENVLDDSQR